MNFKMKIYEIGTGYTSIPAQVPAATESVVEELTKAYIDAGQDVSIIDISDKNRAANSLPIIEAKVPLLFTRSDISLGLMHKLKRVVYSVALARKLKKILKCESEKVVLHFHNQYNAFFFYKICPKKLLKKAFVAYTNHNGMWSLPLSETEKTLKERYFQETYAMKKVDLVIALNDKMRDNILSHLKIDLKKIIVISNGVNTDIYSPLASDEVENIKNKLGLDNKKIILQVGSVNENKGQGRSLDLLYPYLKAHKDLIFAYVGAIVSQEYFDEVNRKASELEIDDQVIYLGTKAPGNDMSELYNIADAIIFSSKYEGFPLVCIEAISAGTPVLGYTDIVSDVGDGYIKTNEENASKIINAVVYNNNEYKELCTNARKNAVEHYDWNVIANLHIEVFDQ